MSPREASVIVLTGIVIAGLLIATWALLCILAAEREHRGHQAEQAKLAEARRLLAAARRQRATRGDRSSGPSTTRLAA